MNMADNEDAPQGGTEAKPPRMPEGDDPRSGDEIKSILGSGASRNSEESKKRSRRPKKGNQSEGTTKK
jgi:hypothetical protein